MAFGEIFRKIWSSPEKKEKEFFSFEINKEEYAKHTPNEDASIFDLSTGLAAVSDGAGGCEGAATASKIVIDKLKTGFEKDTSDLTVEKTKEKIKAILAQAEEGLKDEAVLDAKKKNMAATVSILKFVEGGKKAVFGQMGDSRIYLLRDKKLKQISEEDSFVSKFKKEGMAEDHPAMLKWRSIITDGITASRVENNNFPKEFEPHLSVAEVKKGDLFLICSDGVNDNLKDEEIKNLLLSENSEPAKLLIEKAKEKMEKADSDKYAKPDDATAIIIKVK